MQQRMEELKKKFEIGQKIEGKDPMQYMADLIERNEKEEIEIERLKGSVSILKQMNNYTKNLIDSVRVAIKENEQKFLFTKQQQDSSQETK